MSQMIFINSDTLINVTGMVDNVTGEPVNDATVSATLTDLDGATVYTFDCPYVDDSQGNYQGIIPAATTATLGDTSFYELTITTTSEGSTATKTERVIAGYDGYQ